MGILNVTPDSFSDGGSYPNAQDAVDAALRMMDEGADLIDVGGESTRPGSEGVSADDEKRRVLPVLEQLALKDVPSSIDTRKPEVARAALVLGAQVLNDIGGLRDPKMIEVAATSDCTVCIMHMQGEPQTMQVEPFYENVVQEVKAYLLEQARKAEAAGIGRERIWIDPGIGFGKTVTHNLVLLRELGELTALEYPVLVGVSRKSFLGRIASLDGVLAVSDRLEGTLAAQVVAQMKGVRVIRAHDVLQSARAIRTVAAIVGD